MFERVIILNIRINPATRNYVLALTYREELVDLQIFVAQIIFVFHIFNVNNSRMHQNLFRRREFRQHLHEGLKLLQSQII
jgi:hypothetical protein